MLGNAAVAMWWDVAPETRAEWEDWHSSEHMPERLAIPGFLRGTRWIAGNSYFVLYEVDSLATLTSGAYLERLNNPTPWSRRMMPHHVAMVRDGYGGGISSVMAPMRSPGKMELPRGKGLTSAYLLEAQPMPAQTAEQKIRGKDATADWILLVGGYDEDAVKAAAGGGELYRPAYSLSAGEIA